MTRHEITDRTEPELPVSELLERIAEGRRLMLFTAQMILVPDLLDYLAQLIEEEHAPLRVLRGHGYESIEHLPTGGRLRLGTVTTARMSLPGSRLDVVYLHQCDPPERVWLQLALEHSDLAELVVCR